MYECNICGEKVMTDGEWKPKRHQLMEKDLCKECPKRFDCKEPCFPVLVPMEVTDGKEAPETK